LHRGFGHFERIFKPLAEDRDYEYTMIDATCARSPVQRWCAKKGAQAIGRSRRRPSIKIHALADALVNPYCLDADYGARSRSCLR